MANYTIDKIQYNGNVYNIQQPTPMSTATVVDQTKNGWKPISLIGVWSMNKILDCSAQLNCQITGQAGANAISFTSLRIEKNDNNHDLSYNDENYLYYHNAWQDEIYRTISVTGGADIENLSLYRWFMQNGTKLT